ncbi:MAG TPA: hypothetical protein EYN54_10450 [Methylococcaceae bacterium]|jgi:hypothetical protein|nr:hypothetical protein [Methylococcaceae bacterium]HIA44303.1 hypothetical protein [Methylococcaceae bacterium]HIN68893.1 hypothetical protein [Methylococcales bacterium]HIO44801.1 hypothetical protein [Methylococcales bacterium]
MTKKISFVVFITTFLLMLSSSFHVAYGATPSGRDQIRVHTGEPGKPGDSLFSLTARWRIDGDVTYESTGITFVSGVERPKPSNGPEVAKKLAIALSDGMIKQYPSWRGVDAVNVSGQPEMTVSNKEGFTLFKVTFRDYTNGKMTYDLHGKSFSAAKVAVSVDIVYSAAVEYLAAFADIDEKTSGASGGGIDISIDGDQTISIATQGKTTAQIEQAIASKLSSGQISSSVLYDHTRDGDARNSKPYDGSSVHFLNLPAKSITIQVNDPSLGALMKFKFPDEDAPVSLVKPIMFILLGGAGIALLWFFFGFKPKEED